MTHIFKKLWPVAVLLAAIPLSAQQEESSQQPEEESKISYFFSAENVFEAAVEPEGDSNDQNFAGLENELAFSGGLEYSHSDRLMIFSSIDSYTDLLTDAAGETLLAEQEVAFTVGAETRLIEALHLTTALSLAFNFRPDDHFRLGPALYTGFHGAIEKANLEYELCNSLGVITNPSNLEEKEYIVADVLTFYLYFNPFAFANEDLALGLFAAGEADCEWIYNGITPGDAVIETEFFTGLLYEPTDGVHLTGAFALYHVAENEDEALDLGMKVGGGYTGERFSLEANYIPHISRRDAEGALPASHAFEMVFTLDI